MATSDMLLLSMDVRPQRRRPTSRRHTMPPALIDRGVTIDCEAIFGRYHARAFFNIQICTVESRGGRACHAWPHRRLRLFPSHSCVQFLFANTRWPTACACSTRTHEVQRRDGACSRRLLRVHEMRVRFGHGSSSLTSRSCQEGILHLS